MSASFVEFLLLAVLSLAITFVLFRWLESSAQGQSKVLGGSIKYGGALAGFVVVLWLSAHVYDGVFAREDRTPIDLAGSYAVEEWNGSGSRSLGTATVRQRRGSTRVDISGELGTGSSAPSVSFHTLEAVVHGRQLVWLYQNDQRELGLAMGDIPSDRPDRIVVTYSDLADYDVNADPHGRIVFSRQE